MLNGPSAVAYSLRARRGRRYTALILLFLLPLNLVVVGAVALASGLRIRSQGEPVPGWRQTTGRIAGSVPSNTGREWIYAPVISFRAGGQTVRFDGPTSTTPPVIGTPAQVSYDPAKPADAHDLSISSAVWKARIYVAVTCLVLGLAFMAFFYWLIFVRLKPARRAGGVGTAPGEGRHVRSR